MKEQSLQATPFSVVRILLAPRKVRLVPSALISKLTSIHNLHEARRCNVHRSKIMDDYLMRIPQSRATVCDILRYDRYVPTYAHDRTCNLASLVEARSRCLTSGLRVSWPAIWLKAYAMNARRFPRLRQTWMNWPTPYLHEHHESVGTLVVHRRFENDDWLFWGQMGNLEGRSLPDIQANIDRFQNDPVESIFRRQLWLARKPALVRRMCWWLTFQVSGKKKCKRLGTFFLSTISGKGAEIQDPPSMLTSGFTYGPMDERGDTRVTITYDHRLLDGHHVADILAGLETTLQTALLEELRSLGVQKSAA